MKASTRTTRHPAITRPIRAIVVTFDDAERLPADMEIQFRDGSGLHVAAITKEQHLLYPDLTFFRGRFGDAHEELVVDVSIASAVMDRITGVKGGD